MVCHPLHRRLIQSLQSPRLPSFHAFSGFSGSKGSGVNSIHQGGLPTPLTGGSPRYQTLGQKLAGQEDALPWSQSGVNEKVIRMLPWLSVPSADEGGRGMGIKEGPTATQILFLFLLHSFHSASSRSHKTSLGSLASSSRALFLN